MKKYFFIIIAVITVSMKSDNDRKQLFCQKWMQFAFKAHDQAKPKMTSSEMARTYTFKDDNTYEEVQYNNTTKISGKWWFNEDETKLGFSVTGMNGMKLPESSFKEKPHTIILKLTADTLIYGQEAYYGKDAVYGHDDLYFVKIK